MTKLAEAKKRQKALAAKIRKAERIAKGGDPDRGGGWNKKSVDDHVREGTYRKDRHGPLGPGVLEFDPKPPAIVRDTKRAQRRYINSTADERAFHDGCRFNPALVDHVVKYFSQCLCLHGGSWSGKPFDLEEWQIERLISPLFGWVKINGKGRWVRRYQYTYVEWPKKNGKALDIDTPIATPDGWCSMGDLRVGNYVFDELGLPTLIVAVTGHMIDRPCYRMTFSDGTVVVADAEHEWVTNARTVEGQKRLWTTAEINATQRIQSPGSEGANHSIPVAEPLQLPLKELPVHPYVLGCWLGDGNSSSARITISYEDSELVELLADTETTIEERVSSNENSGSYILGSGGKSQAARNESLQAKLRHLGVLNNKHIPEAYLRGSYSQRLTLLQGLMDTDGTCSKAGQCEFTNTNRQLASGALELIRSLGLKPSWKETRATLYGKDCGPSFRLQFCAFADNPVFRLTRKAARQKPQRSTRPRSTTRQIVSVEPCVSRPVRCIQVDAPSRLYLAGVGMIPTHNSSVASGIGLYMLTADGEQEAHIYSLGADRGQAGIVHDEACEMVKSSPKLEGVCRVLGSAKRIIYDATGSFYAALSGENRGKAGLKIHCGICDELHQWFGRKLFDDLEYGYRARENPLQFVITNAGDDVESVCYKEREKAIACMEGRMYDERFFADVQYASREDADAELKSIEDGAEDMPVAADCNPALGQILEPSRLLADARAALQTPSKIPNFLRYTYGVWQVNANPWIDMTHWEACGEDYTAEDMYGQTAYMAIDGSRVSDMSSVGLIFPVGTEDNPEYRQLVHCWMPTRKSKEYQRLVDIQQWADAGWLTICPTENIDLRTIYLYMLECVENYNIAAVGYDKRYIIDIMQQFEAETGIEVIECGQGKSFYTCPMDEYARLVNSHLMHHNRNDLLTWHAQNVCLDEDAYGKRPRKPDNENQRKIDGVVSGLMALYCAMTIAPPQKSFYDMELA